ncbi:MAG: M28 family peptidase [Acidobacteria bacterium]|nr:M28 family peptidase [Acidobacteriota bacterium]
MRRSLGTAGLFGTLLVALTVVSAAPQLPKGGSGNADAITEDELRLYEYFLASDQLEGRNVPSRGYDTAALYVATHLKEWGLKPGGSTTGTNGPLQPYFIPIELVSNQIDAAGMKFTLNIPPAADGGRGGRGGAGGFGAPALLAPGPRSFEYAKEWTVGGGGGGRGGSPPIDAIDITNAKLVFVGNGYVINKTSTDPYKSIDVNGKFLVVAGQPAELAAAAAAGRGAAGGGRGAAAANPLGIENTDFVTPQSYAAKHGAAGIIMVPTYQQLSAMATPATGRGIGPNGPPYQVVKFQAPRTAVPTIVAGIALANAIFQGEKLTGPQVFEGATTNARLESFELNAEKKVSLHTAITVEKGATENVIAMLEGSDPVLKHEFVVMSAHLDHVGLAAAPNETGDAINNGADDDASGSAALMAIARACAQGALRGIKPKRTMIFLWVAGEEKGLWGSQYFNQFPPVDITKIVADLNMDMIGRSKTPGYVDPPQYKLVEPGEVFVVGPDISSTDLGKIVDTAAAGYKLKVNHFYDTTAPDATHDNLGPLPNGQRIFYRSDHYNFAKVGIPVAFFADGLHTDYHRVTDSPDKIDYKNMQAITKTVAAVGWMVANAAARPKLNAKLPDQLVNDMLAAKAAGWGALTPVPPPLPRTPF